MFFVLCTGTGCLEILCPLLPAQQQAGKHPSLLLLLLRCLPPCPGLQDKPRSKRPVREGTDVGWTSGIVGDDGEEPEGEKPTAADKKVRRYHVVTSAQGAAVHWQVRVHYYW